MCVIKKINDLYTLNSVELTFTKEDVTGMGDKSSFDTCDTGIHVADG